jgi:ABC-type transport system substrate-binding protein
LLILLGLTIYIPIPALSVEPVPPIVPASGTFEKFGPRVHDLIFVVDYDIGDPNLWDNIDLIDIPVPREYVSPWLSDPEVTMGNYSEWGWYEYDLNNMQWPTGDGDHYWQECDTCQKCYDARQFRRAIAHLTNRAEMVSHMGGYAEPMETFIFPAISFWENPDAPKYAYSLTLAAQALADGGFQDWDDDNVLEYSPGHDGVVVEELPPLQMWVRNDDPDRVFAGKLLADDLAYLGVPVDQHVADRSACYYHAWVAYDFHVYTGGWSWVREPDMYYELFHSGKDTYPMSGAKNYVRYHNKEYDKVAWGLKTAATTEEAKFYCDACQMILHRDAASIPTYTYDGFVAHGTNYGIHTGEEVYKGKKWEGFANEFAVGFPNFWTYLNAHPQNFAKGGTLRQGMVVDIERFSPVQAEWFYDWLVLHEIYEPLVKGHPYNATEYVPWLAENYEIGTWDKPGVGNCTKIRFHLVPNVRFHDLVLLKAEDVAFTYQYMKDWVSVAWYRNVINFDHAEVIDNLTVDVYFNIESLWALSSSMIPILPKHIWEGKDPYVWNPEDHDAVIGTGPFICNKDGVVGRVDRMPGQCIHLVANPNYFRNYIWPDVCDADGNVGVRDGKVTMIDFLSVAYPGRIFRYHPELYPELPPWPSEVIEEGDQPLDVNKDGAIDTIDLVEIGGHFGETWPPPWYVDC